jgi:hypothetical protein
MKNEKKTLKMPLNTDLFGEKRKRKSVERLCGTGNGGAANAAVNLAETCIKNKRLEKLYSYMTEQARKHKSSTSRIKKIAAEAQENAANETDQGQAEKENDQLDCTAFFMR